MSEQRGLDLAALSKMSDEALAEHVQFAKAVVNLADALEHMTYQFAYRVRDGELCTGGLSALEHAFEVLGWDDPHREGE